MNCLEETFAHVWIPLLPFVVFTSVICYILLLCSTDRQLMAEKLFLRWCANSSSIYNVLYSHYRRRARTDCRHVYTFNEKNYFTLEFWYWNISLSKFLESISKWIYKLFVYLIFPSKVISKQGKWDSFFQCVFMQCCVSSILSGSE